MHDGRTKSIVGYIDRILISLVAFGFSGTVGVLVDLDHILCGYANGIQIWPVSNLYGCKIWHDLLPLGSGLLIGAVCALGLGLILGLVYDTIRASIGS